MSSIDSLNIKESIIAAAEEANVAELRRQDCEWRRLKKQEDEKLIESTAQERFYERLRVASNANVYRNPLREMPTIPSSDSVQITLDNSRGTPIGEDHDNDTFAAIHGPLDSGDFDEQYTNDEAIYELDLTRVHSEEKPGLR
ncbi:hypothetical protein E4U40_005390, partial [Claviceps sp. LM458 group G5]